MKKNILAILFIFLIYHVSSQSKSDICSDILERRGEICFNFRCAPEEIYRFAGIISVDNYDGDYVTAYANRDEFDLFLKSGKEFNIIEEYRDSSKALSMAFSVDEMTGWDKYPTYEVYVEMMQGFARDYPQICRLDTIGYSVRNRLLLAVKISDNVDEHEAEPEFLYTGQMHGNELISGFLFLRLINHLLEEYGVDEQITKLVNELQIYINPLSNPDGMYYGGNSNVLLSTRNNANFIDLNRNFPRYDSEPTSIQPEIQAMIDFSEQHNFIMSGNSHSGAELMNYPYDDIPDLPADDEWWQLVCREYATNAHTNGDYGYFTDMDNGITNGYAWYGIAGSRQDYMNHFRHCREVTMELSATKLVDSEQLPYFWNANKKAMLDYMEQATYGLRGIITDSLTNLPLVANVYVNGHDRFNSNVYSFPLHGDYYRLLFEGNYEITFSSDGYIPETYTVSINNYEQKVLNIALSPDPEFNSVSQDYKDAIKVYPNPVKDIFYVESDLDIIKLSLTDMSGKVIEEKFPMKNSSSFNTGRYEKGIYMLNIDIPGKKLCKKIILY